MWLQVRRERLARREQRHGYTCVSISESTRREMFLIVLILPIGSGEVLGPTIVCDGDGENVCRVVTGVSAPGIWNTVVSNGFVAKPCC